MKGYGGTTGGTSWREGSQREDVSSEGRVERSEKRGLMRGGTLKSTSKRAARKKFGEGGGRVGGGRVTRGPVIRGKGDE